MKYPERPHEAGSFFSCDRDLDIENCIKYEIKEEEKKEQQNIFFLPKSCSDDDDDHDPGSSSSLDGEKWNKLKHSEKKAAKQRFGITERTSTLDLNLRLAS